MEVAAEVAEFFDQLATLSPQWLLTGAQRRRLTPAVVGTIGAGWAPSALAEFTGSNTAGIRNPGAVLAARLSPSELPAPAAPVGPPGVASATSARGCWTTTATRRGHAHAARPASHTLSRTVQRHPSAASVPNLGMKAAHVRR